MQVGVGPILSLNFLDTTIAASQTGTGAATVLNSSLTCTNAKSISIYNNSKRDFEIIIGTADPGTTSPYAAIFVPGDTTAHMTNGFIQHPINVQQGMKLMARNIWSTAPVTVSSSLFVRIDFWA